MKGTTTNVGANRQLARDFLGLPVFRQRSVLIRAGLIDIATPWSDDGAHSTVVDAFALAARTDKLGRLRELVDEVTGA